MRTLIFTLALFALGAATTSPSRADPYAWCAVYSGGGDGMDATNCGFETLKQCQDTVSGIGGFCEPNPRYTGPVRQSASPAKPAKKPKSNSGNSGN